MAGKYTTKAFKRLAEMLDSKDDKAAAIACREILDRAFGKPVSPTEISGPDGAPLVARPALSDFELANLTVFLLAKGTDAAGEQLPQARKPTVIEQKPADPFAAQRAEQAAEIAALAEDQPGLNEYETVVARQRAERALALAERRPEQPVSSWVEGSASPRPGEDYTPASANVTRFRPRHR